ncbi:MAG: SurA N-terminal domain-containing protein [Bacteroidota bacterium]
MSALSRIRNNIGLVAVIIAVALLGFIMTDLFSSMGNQVNRVPDVGTIGGESVSIQEFSDRYQNTLSQYGGALNEAQQANIMDNVWNTLVSEKALDQELDKVGLEISGDELHDMFTGENINPIVRQYFVPPGEQPDPTKIQNQLQTIIENPDAIGQFKEFEDYLANQRSKEIYENMLRAGYLGSKAASRNRYIEQNRTVDLELVGINYATVPDSLFDISDSELNAYIGNHSNEYKQEAATFIEYVSLPINPTEADTLRAFEEMVKTRPRFTDTPDDSTFMAGLSQTPYNSSFRNIISLQENLRDSLVNAEQGQVLGPIAFGGLWKLFKVVDTREEEDTYVKLNHIFIRPVGSDPSDTTEARSEARNLLSQVNAGNFSSMVNEHTQDYVSKRKDGELGWIGKNNPYGEAFFEAVQKLPIGTTVRGPFKSTQGFHLVQVVGKTQKEFVLAEVESEIYASSETRNAVFSDINQLANQAQNVLKGDLDSAASAADVQLSRSNPLDESTNQITGLPGGRKLVLWAIEADKDDFSEITQIGDNFVYAKVTDKRSKGVQSLAEVRAIVTPKVLNEKKAAYILDKFKGITLGEDLQAVKDALGDGAFTSNANGISFQSASIPGIGADPYIIGKASKLNVGQLSAPLQGANGVYVLKGVNVQEAVELDDESLATKRDTDASNDKTSILPKFRQALVELANVKDNRHKAGY